MPKAKDIIRLATLGFVLSLTIATASVGSGPSYCTEYTCIDGSFYACTDYLPLGENVQCGDMDSDGIVHCTAYIDGYLVWPPPSPFVSPIPPPDTFVSPLAIPTATIVVQEPIPTTVPVAPEPAGPETLCEDLWMGTCKMWTDDTRITRIDCPE